MNDRAPSVVSRLSGRHPQSVPRIGRYPPPHGIFAPLAMTAVLLVSKHLAILHDPGIVGALIVEDPRLCVGGLRQPVARARARRFRLVINRLDQGAPQAKAAGALGD